MLNKYIRQTEEKFDDGPVVATKSGWRYLDVCDVPEKNISIYILSDLQCKRTLELSIQAAADELATQAYKVHQCILYLFFITIWRSYGHRVAYFCLIIDQSSNWCSCLSFLS
jgi:hypothetical protein